MNDEIKQAFMDGYDAGTSASGAGFSGTPKIEAAYEQYLKKKTAARIEELEEELAARNDPTPIPPPGIPQHTIKD